MDKIYQKAHDQSCKDICAEIEKHLPTADVHELPLGVRIYHSNGSVSGVYPVGGNKVDFSTALTSGATREISGITIADCINLLQAIDAQVSRTDEQSATGAVSPIQGKPKSTNSNWKGKYEEVTPTPIIDTSDWWKEGEKFPIGQSAPKPTVCREAAYIDKDSETVSEAIIATVKGSYHVQAMAQHLAEVLPDDSEVCVNDAGNVDIEKGPLKVTVLPRGANLFDITTLIHRNDEYVQAIPRQVHLSFGSAVKFVFDCVTAQQAVERSKGIPYVKDEVADDGTDEEVDLEAFLRSLVPEHLQGSRIHGGHPVSINGNRDVSRPFSDTMDGKVLVDLGPAHGGIQLIDRSLLPPQKYLSNSPTEGVVMVEGIENVNRKPRKFTATGYR